MECEHHKLRPNGRKRSGNNQRPTFWCPDCKKQFNFPHCLTVEYFTRIGNCLRAIGVPTQTISVLLNIPKRTIENYLKDRFFEEMTFLSAGSIGKITSREIAPGSEESPWGIPGPVGFGRRVLQIILPAIKDRSLPSQSNWASFYINFLKEYCGNVDPNRFTKMIQYENVLKPRFLKEINKSHKHLEYRWVEHNNRHNNIPDALQREGLKFHFEIQDVSDPDYNRITLEIEFLSRLP